MLLSHFSVSYCGSNLIIFWHSLSLLKCMLRCLILELLFCCFHHSVELVGMKQHTERVTMALPNLTLLLFALPFNQCARGAEWQQCWQVTESWNNTTLFPQAHCFLNQLPVSVRVAAVTGDGKMKTHFHTDTASLKNTLCSTSCRTTSA